MVNNLQSEHNLIGLNDIFDISYNTEIQLECANSISRDTLTLPRGLQALGSFCFKEDISYNIDTLIFNKSLYRVGESAFAGIRGIDKIIVNKDLFLIESGAFKKSGIRELSLDCQLIKIPKEMCDNCRDLTNVVLPSNIFSIGSRAFCCTGLKSIEFPDSLRYIETAAFSYTGLKSIDLKNVIYVGRSAFSVTPLEEVRFNQKYMRICIDAFAGCPKLKRVYIPKGAVYKDTFSGLNVEIIEE